MYLVGQVERPLALSLTEIEQRFWMAALHVPAPGQSGAAWTGIPLAVLLRAAGVLPVGRRVRCAGHEGASVTLLVADILAADLEGEARGEAAGPLVVYAAGAAPLSDEQGRPLRLVRPVRPPCTEGVDLCVIEALG